MHLFLNLFIGKQSTEWASSLISLLLISPTFAGLSHLWRCLMPKKEQVRAALILATAAVLLCLPSRGQTFKAVPLDCGGWFSGFAQADNGRLYGYGDVYGAWRSDNGGTTWSYLNWSIPGGDIAGTGMAVQKNNADVVYYCTGSALWKSTNGGGSWNALLSDLGDSNDIYQGTPRFRGTSPILIRSNDPNEIWFAGPRKGQQGWLWKSSDGGDHWVKAGGNNFDSNRARTLHNVAAFANQIWVGSDNGLYVSTDGGDNFNLVGGSGRLSEVGMIARFTTGTFAGVGLVTRSNGGGGGISRITATDYGNAATYSVTDAATNNIYFGYPTGLQIFSDGSASAWNTSADRHGFSPAGNGGQLFTVRPTTLNTSVVPIWTTAAALAARNTPDYGSDQVIEAVGNPNKWIITGGFAPMYSLDKGLSWQYFPNGSGLAGVKTYLASVSRYDVNRIYVPGSDIGSAIITDGGSSGQATFCSNKSYNGLHGTFRVLEGPNTQNLVLAGLDQGASATLILKSSNGGASWDVVSQTGNGLPRSLDGITKSVMSFTDANDFLVVLASGTAHSDPIPPGLDQSRGLAHHQRRGVVHASAGSAHYWPADRVSLRPLGLLHRARRRAARRAVFHCPGRALLPLHQRGHELDRAHPSLRAERVGLGPARRPGARGEPVGGRRLCRGESLAGRGPELDAHGPIHKRPLGIFLRRQDRRIRLQSRRRPTAPVLFRRRWGDLSSADQPEL
ncbi:hypothetical protein IC235_08915 [Hymenobacter sp. BT664]|uniref:Photosynthesis system II assembly factor Ycf48/Hcf136-like domain-containing protein n=1 Tax=Hymenobacter montanus TaxID=2771359 RepID=A0A927GJ10_9BACT|nr:hypothetical protein [Hymenobacter montanus]MBD2768008.1 hypothetical protein [Hymenobacter montanus]